MALQMLPPFFILIISIRRNLLQLAAYGPASTRSVQHEKSNLSECGGELAEI